MKGALEITKFPENETGLAAHIVILFVNRSPDASWRKVFLPRREGVNHPWAGAGGPWPELATWGRARLPGAGSQPHHLTSCTCPQLDIMDMYDVHVGVSTLLKTNGEQHGVGAGGANRTNANSKRGNQNNDSLKFTPPFTTLPQSLLGTRHAGYSY